MIQQKITEARYFFYSQAFADGLRATLAIVLPALIGSYAGDFQTGLSISLGALVVSLTDAPGPLLHKRNGMLASAGFAFIVALLTAFAQPTVYTLALEIVLVTFFFSMFAVFGNRATAVGNAAVLVMILTMDQQLSGWQQWRHALMILSGGLFYTSLSLLVNFIRPYRSAQRALGDCIFAMSAYLSIRADFYNTATNLEENYKKLVAQQITVNEKQDAVRELFFKTRQIIEESTAESRKLVFTFVSTIDLFEDITASYYDYRLLREKFGHSGALNFIHVSLKKIVFELSAVGLAIEGNTSFNRRFDYEEEVRSLKKEVDSLTGFSESDKLVLKKIIVNIRKLYSDLLTIEEYFEKHTHREKTRGAHSHFISHQPISLQVVADNLTLRSSAFRHAIRVATACLVGFLLTKIFAYGAYSYWILLTIAFILKPAFALTKERNIQRLIGTFAGAAIGVGFIYFVPNQTALFFIMVLFMIGSYSFLRLNYLLMVLFTTPYIFILFNFLGVPFQQVATERILDTVIGCAIAFCTSYFLFPKWERDELKQYMNQVVAANAAYLQKVIQSLSGNKVSTLEYKLARREVYLHSANLSSLFQRMLSEPRNKQGATSRLQMFVVLNHILFSNIATVATIVRSETEKTYPEDLIQWARKAERRLLGEDGENLPASTGLNETITDRQLMNEQLQFIYTVSNDISKLMKGIE